MLDSFLIVLRQVSVLFLLIATGWFLGKRRIFNDGTAASMNTLILNVCNPCIVVQAFQTEYTAETLRGFLFCAAAAMGIHLICLAAGALATRKMAPGERAVYAMSTTLTNCGFMAFPLETALIGSAGILYGSGYLVVMNLVTFTIGYYSFTHDRRSISLRQVVTRPSILGVIVGLALFLLRIPLPDVVGSAVGYLAALCVPIPMMVIGYQLSKADFRRILKSRRNWAFSLLRLVVLPLVFLALMRLCGLRGDVFLATAVAASCPAAAIVSILAERLGSEGTLAAELGAMQTALSLVTMPVILSLASILA